MTTPTNQGQHPFNKDGAMPPSDPVGLIASLQKQVEQLREALSDCVESLERCVDNPHLTGSPSYRVSCLQQARKALEQTKP